LIRSPEWHVRRYLQSGRLREVLAQWMCPPAPISIIYPNRGLVSPTVRVFIDWIASVFDASPLARHNEMFVLTKTEQLPSVS
jgi:LysR family transcriptional regulator for bpeEF and oprC